MLVTIGCLTGRGMSARSRTGCAHDRNDKRSRRAAALFVELPQLNTEIDDAFLEERRLEKILVTDQKLCRHDSSDSSQLAGCSAVFETDLFDESALEAVYRAIRAEFDVVAVLGCSEISVMPAAWLAEKFKVKGIGIEVARLCRDKFSMIACLADAGIPCPQTVLANPESTAGSIKARLGGYPLICKPLMGFASFGVIRVDSDQALEEAIKQVARKSRFVLERHFGFCDERTAAQVLIQSYLPGSEFAIDGYVRQGRSHILSVIDKPDVSDGPYFEDRSYVTPSRLGEDAVRRLEHLTQQVVDAIGLDESPFHLEIRMNGDRCHVLEIGARTGLIQSLRRSRGIDQIAVALALKLGESPPVTPRWNRYAASICLSADKHGRFHGIQNMDELLSDSSISGIRVLAQPGQRVAPPPDTTGYLGIISVAADSYAEATCAIDNARAKVKLDIR